MSIIGIDLGTTYSLVGCMQGGKPLLIPDAEGHLLYPSVVWVDDDKSIYTGHPAKYRMALKPEQGAVHFKRDMGTGKRYRLKDMEFLPEELSAHILGGLKAQAELYLGETITQAVITVPAYFGEAQRQATRSAAQIAGLEVLRLVNEPTAAAIAYGYRDTETEQKIAVLDLGGGTFDVTILEIFDGIIIKASSGDSRLGGMDFDNALVEWVHKTLKDRNIHYPRNQASQAKLTAAVEKAKKQLAKADTAEILVPGVLMADGKLADIMLPLSLAEAETLWADLTARLVRPVRTALADSGWRADEIDHVLLVGGSSRLRLMTGLALDVFAKFPQKDIQPDQTVAMGAVITAGLMASDAALDDLVVTDIAPFSMGMELARKASRAVVTDIYSPIIERGTVIPCSRKTVVSPMDDRASSVNVEIFQGEHPLCSKNTKLGSLEVSGIPLEPLGRLVEIRFTYDLNGLLEVEATILMTGKKHALLITRSDSTMSEEEIAAARKAMSGLKIPPEQEHRNATILARAELAFIECKGELREEVQNHIAEFRSVLASGSPAEIDKARLTLMSVLDNLEL